MKKKKHRISASPKETSRQELFHGASIQVVKEGLFSRVELSTDTPRLKAAAELLKQDATDPEKALSLILQVAKVAMKKELKNGDWNAQSDHFKHALYARNFLVGALESAKKGAVLEAIHLAVHAGKFVQRMELREANEGAKRTNAGLVNARKTKQKDSNRRFEEFKSVHDRLAPLHRGKVDTLRMRISNEMTTLPVKKGKKEISQSQFKKWRARMGHHSTV